MRAIAELNMLLRERIELPAGLKMTTDEFREGWSFIKSNDARRLEKRILKSGWNFIRIADGSLRSGVGETQQEAIASALKLALRRVNTHFNAVQVEHIELTKYPWFFLARVRIYPYRIQEGAILAVSDEVLPDGIGKRPARSHRLANGSAEMYPDFGSAMPMLKHMLTTARASEATN
ncbi:MAG: hypothetical protein ABR976_22135 [Terracidiphilus sp.]|jgi:hypothetical protein